MSGFRTFMDLTDAGIANEYAAILEENMIPFKLQDTSKDFDPSMSNNTANKTFMLMLDPKDFEKTNALLESKTSFDINEIEPSHPFFSFSTAELSEVVMNYDEWNPLDVKLAKYLLKKQNVAIDTSEIKSHQKEKEINKATEDESTKSGSIMILIGYVFCLAGGFLGFAIGVFLITAKKELPNGTKVFVYKKPEREHGYLMLIAGLAMATLLIYVNLK